MRATVIKTGEGGFTAHYSEKGLARLDFPDGKGISNRAAAEASPPVHRWRRLTERALKQALAGKRPKSLPPLDLSAGTDFQQSVWKALRQIPAGNTKTYGQIAQAIKRPAAVRAVGQACGANPIPLLIPCHRVIAANGRLGGFSCGVELKRRLLRREGILIRADAPITGHSTHRSSPAAVRSRDD